ncbi:MAG: DEAD/DEAH box helicase [Elusimicrobia bacterium]|nr:DEAD/DEAH box helicase [Elusimicrobiota bacterium]
MTRALSQRETAGRLLQTGDRFEVEVDREFLGEGLLALDPLFPPLPSSLRLVRGGSAVEASYDAAQHAIVSPCLTALAHGGRLLQIAVASESPLTLELLPPERIPSPEDLMSLGPRGALHDLPVDPGDMEILRRCAEGDFSRPDEHRLHEQAVCLALSPGFQTLVAPAHARDLTPYRHQVEAVRRALGRFRGRALLCDEVGLGKTVEAGLILLELVIRGLARRVLVLTPPSLTSQWREEMIRKFGLEFALQEAEGFRAGGEGAWKAHDRVIASFHTAKREAHRQAVLQAGWDLIIIDEAHHLRNRNTVLWRFASELRSPYLLMLTATPVQNDLDELFNLIQVLRPGHLETAKRFEENFVSRSDRLKPKNAARLQDLLAEVMVRNRRSSTEVALTRRHACTLQISPSPDEGSLYADMTAYLRSCFRAPSRERAPHDPGALDRMSLMILQAELGSSPAALAPTLAKMAARAPEHAGKLEAFRDRAAAISRPAKLERLLRLLRGDGLDGGLDADEKLLVFTRFKATQAYLAARLREEGVRAAIYSGDISRLEKEDAVKAFAGPVRVLLSTESGGEGRNLQFCRALLNYDLPWNPMRIEQRIGRLSRIGQEREVLVFNFSAAGTLEASILHLLDAKINLFELVVGEVGMILGRIEEEAPFEDIVFDRWIASEGEADFQRGIDEFGDCLAQAREEYLRILEREDQLFGDRLQPGGKD